MVKICESDEQEALAGNEARSMGPRSKNKDRVRRARHERSLENLLGYFLSIIWQGTVRSYRIKYRVGQVE